MTTVSTSLLPVSASAIQIRLLYGYGSGNENRSFFHYGNKKMPSLTQTKLIYEDRLILRLIDGELTRADLFCGGNRRQESLWRKPEPGNFCVTRRINRAFSPGRKKPSRQTKHNTGGDTAHELQRPHNIAVACLAAPEYLRGCESSTGGGSDSCRRPWRTDEQDAANGHTPPLAPSHPAPGTCSFRRDWLNASDTRAQPCRCELTQPRECASIRQTAAE